jgi:hypothetical protein
VEVWVAADAAKNQLLNASGPALSLDAQEIVGVPGMGRK